MILPFSTLSGVPFLMVLGNSMLFPIFPKLQSALGLSEVQTSLIVTAFSVPAGLLIPLAGYLSDQYGRRIVMIPAVAIFGVGALIGGLATSVLGPSYPLLLVGRIIQGAGAAGMTQLAMALVADIFRSSERSKALGLLEAANGFGKVLSPIAGGAFGMLLWYLPFYLFAVLAIPLLLGLVFLVREPRPPEAVPWDKYVKEVTGAFARKGASLLSALISGAVALFILFGTLFFLAEILEKKYGLSEISSGFILAIPVSAMAVTAYAVGIWEQKHRGASGTAVWVGLSVMAVVMGLVTILTDRWLMLGAIFLMGIGAGFILPSLNLLITSAVSPGERGMITSFYGAVRFFGVALGPLAFGYLTRFGQPVLFGSAAGVAAVAAVLAIFLLRPRRLLGGGGAGRGRVKNPA